MGVMHRIAAGLLPLSVPVETLHEDPKNANTHDERSVRSIAESLRAFGQRKPIIVRESTGTITAGNGTFRAALSLGWTDIAALMVDDDQATATAFALADNKTTELSTWDDQALAAALSYLETTAPELTAATGFSDDEILRFLPTSTGGDVDFDIPMDDQDMLPVTDGGTLERVPATPTLRYGQWALYMDGDDAALLEEKIKAHIEKVGTTHGFAGRLIRAC